MRVLFYTETYSLGGCDRYLVDLVRGLEGSGIELAMAGNEYPEFDAWLAERAPELLPRITPRIANLREPALGKLWRRVRGDAPAAPAEPAAGDPSSAGAVGRARQAAEFAARTSQAALNERRLRAVIRQVRPDVLHINNGGYPGGESCRVAALAARAEGVPAIVHFVHNMAYPRPFPEALEERFDRRVDAATDLWVTAAERASDALATVRGFDRGRIRTVHYGLPPRAAADPSGVRTELGLPGGEPLLAVVAAFEERKGHRYLFEALSTLDARPHTLLVGTGPERGRLEALARELGLGDRVHFLGWRGDVDRILAAGDALVLPSIGNECLPYAILEAMELGLPVVSTDVAGIPEEVLDGETGRVVAPADAPALAAAIRELLSDPDRARRMGEAGRERVRSEFTLERMTARTRAVWDEALASS